MGIVQVRMESVEGRTSDAASAFPYDVLHADDITMGIIEGTVCAPIEEREWRLCSPWHRLLDNGLLVEDP